MYNDVKEQGNKIENKKEIAQLNQNFGERASKINCFASKRTSNAPGTATGERNEHYLCEKDYKISLSQKSRGEKEIGNGRDSVKKDDLLLAMDPPCQKIMINLKRNLSKHSPNLQTQMHKSNIQSSNYNLFDPIEPPSYEILPDIRQSHSFVKQNKHLQPKENNQRHSQQNLRTSNGRLDYAAVINEDKQALVVYADSNGPKTQILSHTHSGIKTKQTLKKKQTDVSPDLIMDIPPLLAMSQPHRSTHTLQKHKANLKPIQHKTSVANSGTIKCRKNKLGLDRPFETSNKIKKDMVYCPMPLLEREGKETRVTGLQQTNSRKQVKVRALQPIDSFDAHNVLELNRLLEQRVRQDDFTKLKKGKRSRMLMETPIAIPLFVAQTQHSSKSKNPQNGYNSNQNEIHNQENFVINQNNQKNKMSERISQLNFTTDASRGPPGPQFQVQEKISEEMTQSIIKETSPQRRAATQGVAQSSRYTIVDFQANVVAESVNPNDNLNLNIDTDINEVQEQPNKTFSDIPDEEEQTNDIAQVISQLTPSARLKHNGNKKVLKNQKKSDKVGNKKNPGSPISNQKRGKQLAKLVNEAIYSVISPKERDHSRTLITPSGRATISTVSKTQIRQPQIKQKLKGVAEEQSQPGRLEIENQMSNVQSNEIDNMSNHYATLPNSQNTKGIPSLLPHQSETIDRQRGASLNARLETEIKQEIVAVQLVDKEKLIMNPQNRSQSTNQNPKIAQTQQTFTNILAEQTDPEKRAQQMENYLSNLNQKASKQGTHIGPRELNRQWFKKQIEQSESNCNHNDISPVRLGQSAYKNEPSNSIPESVVINSNTLSVSPNKNKAIALPDDRLICLIRTNEPHLKRAVERRSQYWIENKNKFPGSATVFDVKFEFQDHPADYSNLRNCQLYNHFQYNTEITTKSGLCKTLYMNTSPCMKVDQWFPRCYDLSQAGQTDELIDDYQSTAIQNIIKKHYQMFKSFCKVGMNSAFAQLSELKQKRDNGTGAYNYMDDISNLRWDLINQSPCPGYVFVHTQHLERALNFCAQLIKNQFGKNNMNDLVKDELRPHDQRKCYQLYGLRANCTIGDCSGNGPSHSRMFSEKAWQQLLGYSKQSFPILDFTTLPSDLRPDKKGLKALQATLKEADSNQTAKRECYADSTGNPCWENPSMLLVCKVIKYHKTMKRLIAQYSTDGTRNVWIVKPCYNARGFGIYCIDNCLQEFSTFTKNAQAQSKIVQKYIEKPLLLTHHNEIRKFDIRQWVLVTSFDPLQIYIFSEFYLRICGSRYELNDIQDSYKHLTNFSIQKHNSKVSNKDEDLVMSQEEFFRKAFKNDKNKCDKVRKSIEEVIIRTIRSGQEAGVEHRPNSFEIYGFDFMLDRKLKPWLLEVNLSPACAERTDWLVSMLDRMASGLFFHLERRILKVTDDFKGDLRAHLNRRKNDQCPDPAGDQGWQLIYDQATQSQNYLNLEKQAKQQLAAANAAQASTTMMNFGHLGGQAAGLGTVRQQPQLDSGATQTQAVVQNRDHPLQAGLELYATKIQPRQERKVQQLYYQELAARIIQKRYRGFKAQRLVAQMKFELIVIYVQSFARMFLAKKERQRLREQKYAVTVQKYLRKFLAKKIYFQMISDAFDQMKLRKIQMIQKRARIFIARVREINRFKNMQAIIIQKFIKGKQARQRVWAYRSYLTRVITIQRCFRKRYALKRESSVTVQKFLKGLKVHRRYQRLRSVKHATVNILE